MSFSSPSSDIITQSGTDTSLSGLSSISGVTVTNLGRLILYDLGSSGLKVTGTLSINDDDASTREMLVLGQSDSDFTDINVDGGTLNVGHISVKNSDEYISDAYLPSIYEKYSHSFQNSMGKEVLSSGSKQSFLAVRNGGTLNWYGCINCSGGIGFDGTSNAGHSNSFINIRDAIWDCRNTDADQALYSYTPELHMDGFTILSDEAAATSGKWAQIIILASPILMKGYNPVFSEEAICGSATSPTDLFIEFVDYPGARGGGTDFRSASNVATNGEVHFINSNLGSTLILGIQEPGYKRTAAYQEVTGSIVDSMGKPLTNGVLATKDVNNLLYASSASASGIFDLGGINLAEWNTDIARTLFNPSGTDNDVWSFYGHFYGYLSRSRLDVLLRGVGGTQLNFTGTEDEKSTESDIAVVLAYTSYNTGEKIYDAACAWKISLDNVAYPSIETRLLEAKGDKLDFGSLKVVLDTGFANVIYANPEDGISGETSYSSGADITPTQIDKPIIIAIDLTTLAGVDPNGCLLELGGFQEAAGEDFSYGPYSMDSSSTATSHFNFSDPLGTGLDTGGTARRWCWDNNDSPSSNVGPASGHDTAGYVYTESSSPGAAGDLFNMEFNQTFSTEDAEVTVEFYTNQRGDDNDAICRLQVSVDGGAYSTIATYGGSSDPNKVSSSGTQIWAKRSEVLSVSSANTKVRVQVELQGSTIWHCDYGLDSFSITGIASSVSSRDCLYIGFDDSDLVLRAGDGTTSDSDNMARATYSISNGLRGLDGTLFALVDPLENKVDLKWLDNTDPLEAVINLATDIAVGSFTNWANTELGKVGSVNGVTAIGETTAAFNGTITQCRIYLDEAEPNPFQTSSGDPAFMVDKVTDTVTIDTMGTVQGTTAFRQIGTTGGITLKNSSTLEGYTVTDDLILENNQVMKDLTVMGCLDFTLAGTYTFQNCVIQEVTNSSGGSVIVNPTNCTFTTNSGPNITINNSVQIAILVKDAVTKLPIEAARVYLQAQAGGSLATLDTDENGEVSLAYNYVSDFTLLGRVRKSTAQDFYKTGSISGLVTAAGFTATVLLLKDA